MRTALLLLAGRAAAYARRPAHDAALRDLDDAVAITPEDALVLHNRGNIHLARGNTADAIAHYTRGIARGAASRAHFDRGLAHGRLGDKDGAAAVLRVSLARDAAVWRKARAHINRLRRER
ncbi:MAG: hypothetical protein NW223_11985 [Hyphomicrobiaceae bacterium]|nr:hypothetical protein [Hyphomicrobiaceae bacterium]